MELATSTEEQHVGLLILEAGSRFPDHWDPLGCGPTALLAVQHEGERPHEFAGRVLRRVSDVLAAGSRFRNVTLCTSSAGGPPARRARAALLRALSASFGEEAILAVDGRALAPVCP